MVFHRRRRTRKILFEEKQIQKIAFGFHAYQNVPRRRGRQHYQRRSDRPHLPNRLHEMAWVKGNRDPVCESVEPVRNGVWGRVGRSIEQHKHTHDRHRQ